MRLKLYRSWMVGCRNKSGMTGWLITCLHTSSPANLFQAPRTNAGDTRDATDAPWMLKHVQYDGHKKGRPPRGSRPFFCSRPRLAPRPRKPCGLLQLDGRAGGFELGLDLLGLFLVHAFLDGLRSALDEGLRLGQAELGDGADFLDDVDLLATVAGEDHVELVLGLFGRGATTGTAGCRAGNGDGRSSRDAPLLFQKLGKVSRLEDGQFGKLVNQRVQVCHF